MCIHIRIRLFITVFIWSLFRLNVDIVAFLEKKANMVNLKPIMFRVVTISVATFRSPKREILRPHTWSTMKYYDFLSNAYFNVGYAVSKWRNCDRFFQKLRCNKKRFYNSLKYFIHSSTHLYIYFFSLSSTPFLPAI